MYVYVCDRGGIERIGEVRVEVNVAFSWVGLVTRHGCAVHGMRKGSNALQRENSCTNAPFPFVPFLPPPTPTITQLTVRSAHSGK
jgi:hypothetical protein